MTTTILVTGAAGFVGRHLMPALRTRFPAAELVAATADVTDDAAVRAEISARRPSHLVHLAAVAVPSDARRDPGLAWRVNLQGTLSVAQAILAEAPGCTLLFASSADAYGRSFAAGSMLDERAPLAPINAYGATKAAADLALGAMVGDGLRLIRMRPFNHTGPGQSDALVVPAFARQIVRIAAGKQAPVIEVGALDAARDFLDVRDVVAAYGMALERADALAPGAIFNLGSGVARRIGDVLADLLRLSGIATEIRADPARLRPTDIPVAVGDASLARRLLGWAPAVKWEQTLSDVLADWRMREG